MPALQAGATLIVNDRADIARLLDAGLHVGQDDIPPRDARRLLGEHLLLGYSTHNAEQLAAAAEAPASYLALGPMFTTLTRENTFGHQLVTSSVCSWTTGLPFIDLGESWS